MGGASVGTLLRLFGSTPMPVTMDDLKKNNPECDMVYQVVETMAGSPRGAIRTEKGFWISDWAMNEGIAEAEKNIHFWQGRIEYLRAQKEALAKAKIS